MAALPSYPRERIAQIQARLDGEVSRLRNDKHLSDTGRLAQMATALRAANSEVAELRKKASAAREARREELQRSLFGMSNASATDVLVMRDSQDRASALASEEEAALKLKLATTSGDKHMANAIAAVAVAKGWTAVVDTYASGNTYTREGLDELASIPSGRRTELADAAVFRVRPPKELLGRSDDVLAAIERADQAAVKHLEGMQPRSLGDVHSKFEG